MASLYKLQGDLLQIQQMIEDGVEGLEDTLESVQMAVEDKLEGYAMVIKNIQSDVEGLRAEEKRLAERRKSMEANIERMKEAMAMTLSTVEGNRLKTEKFTFSFRKSKSVEIENMDLIPEIYLDFEPKVSKKSIGESLKNGFEVPGAKLVEKQSLSIK